MNLLDTNVLLARCWILFADKIIYYPIKSSFRALMKTLQKYVVNLHMQNSWFSNGRGTANKLFIQHAVEILYKIKVLIFIFLFALTRQRCRTHLQISCPKGTYWEIKLCWNLWCIMYFQIKCSCIYLLKQWFTSSVLTSC